MQIDGSNPFSALGIGSQASAASDRQLGQQDFLRLMMAQFQNQNPLEPMENTEFLGQMAQFSMVDGVQQLNSGFATLADRLAGEQTLAAASLLGREVLVETDRIYSEDGFSGVVSLPTAATRVEVDILNASGDTVRRLTLNGSSAGELAFEWDGTDSQGVPLGAGTYTVQARGVDGSGSTALTTLLAAPVTAVRREGADVTLELDGLPPARLSDVRRIA
jgi:flagellar basal-body rod modification protein FlgD